GGRRARGGRAEGWGGGAAGPAAPPPGGAAGRRAAAATGGPLAARPGACPPVRPPSVSHLRGERGREAAAARLRKKKCPGVASSRSDFRIVLWQAVPGPRPPPP